jgi:hypothetical protein
MGGANIDSALQVDFMLWVLLLQYHSVVEDFRLGHRSLAMAALQSVVDQCIAYDRDPWKGPVGWNGKPSSSPLANAAGTSSKNGSDPYDAMHSVSFNKHLTQWRFTCKDRSEKCLVCHNTSKDKAHNTKDCLILKKLELKILKRTPADSDATY